MSFEYIERSKNVFDEKIHWQLQQTNLPYIDLAKTDTGYRYAFTRALTQEEVGVFDETLGNHTITENYGVKIYKYIEDESANKDYTAVDYKVQALTNFFPKRDFAQGELRRVEWHSNKEFTDLILSVDITYTRDAFGFALKRKTVRTWYDFEDNEMPRKKITEKIYTPLEMIKEGKRRRGNIVDGVQLPTFAFLQEVLAKPPYNKTPTEILLMGRDFMDRFESEFNRFIDNSSTVTNPESPNVGRKSVIVAFEQAAETTDPWLSEPVLQIGGASVLQYLTSEFNI
jgi:hypothetical protein